MGVVERGDPQAQLQAILKPVAAPREPVKLGEIGCDFAAPISFRNFVDATGNDTGDDGWLFYFPSKNASGQKTEKNSYLAKEGQSMPAKVYLKFEVEPGASDGVGERQGSKWQFVNGHQVDLVLSSALVYLQKIPRGNSSNGMTSSQAGPSASNSSDSGQPAPVELSSSDGTQEDTDETEPEGCCSGYDYSAVSSSCQVP